MADNINVAIRVRPLIKREIENNDPIWWKTKGSLTIYPINSSTTEYCFDRVFNSDEGNAFIYKTVCASIVQSVMEGFNGTIFAYGQTSSGKTYTMSGEYGVIPSAIQDIFDTIDSMPEREFLLRVSFMEIYNECIIDLLSDGSKDLKPAEDVDGIITVMGLSEREIKTPNEVFQIMKRCEKKRQTGDTLMNEKSSRSHAIFRMIIESRMRNTDENSVVSVGQLNLVDLAGSERPGQMGTTGVRYKEGININKSLSNLANVINQLSTSGKNDKQYVSYRDSKLTRILQNSLGGNARTVIICTVTPAAYQETLSTINFASSAKRIRNKPKANVVTNDKALLQRYTKEIKLLSKKLETLQQLGDSGKKYILEKELEEKNKQNQDLLQQIQDLKEKFVVSQFPPGSPNVFLLKKNRRETWCPGAILGRKSTLTQGHLNPLPMVKEETFDASLFTDFIDIKPDIKPCGYCSSVDYSPVSKTNIGVQTEKIKDKELVEKLHKKLNTTIKEYQELKEFTTSEKQILKVSNLETSRMMTEDFETKFKHDALLLENNKLQEQIIELTQKNKMLSEQNAELKYRCEEFGEPSAISPQFHSTQYFSEEVQLLEKKFLTNYGIKIDVGIQTKTKSHSEMSAQTELREKCNKSVQFEYEYEKSMVENECQTKCIVTMETAIQTDNVSNVLQQDKKMGCFDETSVLCKNCLTKCDDSADMVIDVPAHQSTVLDCAKQMNDLLSTAVSAQESFNDRIASQFSKTCSHTFSTYEKLDEFKEDLNLIDIAKQHVSVKYEHEIRALKYEINNLKMDNEHQLSHFKSLCTEKDLEIDKLLNDIEALRQNISSKVNELTIWRKSASETYDKYLIMLKEKNAVLKQLQNFETTNNQKESLVKKLKEEIKLIKFNFNHQKTELLELIQTYAETKENLDILEKNHLKEFEKYEQEKDKLNITLSMLKTQFESDKRQHNKIIEDLKSHQVERVASVEKQLKENHVNEMSKLEIDLNKKHALKLAEETDKLQIQLITQVSSFRLERTQFEEKVLKENRDIVLKIKHAFTVKEECEKLKILVDASEQRKTNSGKDDSTTTKYKTLLEINQRELQSFQSMFEDTQTKLELTEKTLTELQSSRKRDLENIQSLNNEKSHLESLIKERDLMIKQHSAKFYQFKEHVEKEYMKLKFERDALMELRKMEEENKSSSKNTSSDGKSSWQNSATNGNLMDDIPNSTLERRFEINEIQSRCAKLKEENKIFSQKLSSCLTEIRRLHDLNNESKVGKEAVASNITTSSVTELQGTLQKKERQISRLEKEIKKYKDYLKSKGHHRVVNEDTAKENMVNENKVPISTIQKSQQGMFQNVQPSVQMHFATTPQRFNVPKEEKLQNICSQSDSEQPAAEAKKLLDLECNDSNCKQQ